VCEIPLTCVNIQFKFTRQVLVYVTFNVLRKVTILLEMDVVIMCVLFKISCSIVLEISEGRFSIGNLGTYDG
jgi:hypothetical protein